MPARNKTSKDKTKEVEGIPFLGTIVDEDNKDKKPQPQKIYYRELLAHEILILDPLIQAYYQETKPELLKFVTSFLKKAFNDSVNSFHRAVGAFTYKPQLSLDKKSRPPIAYIFYDVEADMYETNFLNIGDLYVSPEYRSAIIARELIKRALDFGDRCYAQYVQTTVSNPKLKSLYRSCGLVSESEIMVFQGTVKELRENRKFRRVFHLRETQYSE